jgi:phenylacetate-CoA ligase
MLSALSRRQVIQYYQLATGRRPFTRLDELNQTQWWEVDRLLALQKLKMHRLLTYAHEHVPYYHRLFDECGFQPGDVLSDVTSLHRLPILTKEIIRQNYRDLQTCDATLLARSTEQSTTGSTGHPLVIMQDSNCRDHVTADLYRHHGWAGWRLGDPHCYIWSARGGMQELRAPRTRLMNWLLNRFITSTLTLSDQNMAEFASMIRRRHPHILHSFPSALYRFGHFLRKNGFQDIKFEAVFTGAETLYPEQRRFIEETFGSRVFNRYGAVEAGGIACECEAHDGMHVSVENNYVEILKDGQPARPGAIGNVVVTNLNNYTMPLVRYDLEDTGAWATDRPCPCGRALPLMSQLEGRACDLFQTRQGLTVGGATAGNLFGVRGIKQFQVVQKSLDLIVVCIVRDSDFDQAETTITERMLKKLLGAEVEVRFEFPDDIPVSESGKHRYAICEIPDETGDQAAK